MRYVLVFSAGMLVGMMIMGAVVVFIMPAIGGPHISISGNDDFASQAAVNGWRGDGTKENPYVIEGYEITGIGTGIVIEGTSVWFVIRNCRINTAGNGIYLSGVENGAVENCVVVSGANEGITVTNSRNVKIVDCTASSAFYFGIYSYMSSDVEIINCTAYQNDYYGIMVESSQNVRVLNCTTYDNTYVGIYFKYSTRCTALNNEMRGEGMFVYGSVEECTLHRIENNTVNDMKVYYYRNLSASTLDLPEDAGQVILANVTSPVSHLVISDLNLSYASCGVLLLHSSKIEVRNFSIWGSKVYGIYSYQSEDIVINSSVLGDNRFGAFIAYSHNITIRDNKITRNWINGVRIRYSTGGAVTGNVFRESGKYGLYLYIGTSGITVYGNDFYDNNGATSSYDPYCAQACDDGESNAWNTQGGIGNYWSDWTSPDENSDGVVDQPYAVDGVAGSKDYYPLVRPNRTL